NKEKFYKDGRWTFPASVLGDAARQEGLSDPCLQDAWGQGFKLVARKGPNPTGHAQFDAHDIISAGPDRDYQTADDLRWTRTHKQKAGGWWSSGGRGGQIAVVHPPGHHTPPPRAPGGG